MKYSDLEEVAMLDGTRITPVDIKSLPDDLREVLEEQRKVHGTPLYPYLFYARNPPYFRAAHAMWTTLQHETKRVPGTRAPSASVAPGTSGPRCFTHSGNFIASIAQPSTPHSGSAGVKIGQS